MIYLLGLVVTSVSLVTFTCFFVVCEQIKLMGDVGE